MSSEKFISGQVHHENWSDYPALALYPSSQLIVRCYAFFLACIGLIVALIDIPFINNFQIRVPEDIRGRSLSINISIVKVFTPIGYILSGSIIGIIPAFYLPLCGGILLLLFYITIHINTKIK